MVIVIKRRFASVFVYVNGVKRNVLMEIENSLCRIIFESFCKHLIFYVFKVVHPSTVLIE